MSVVETFEYLIKDYRILRANQQRYLLERNVSYEEYMQTRSLINEYTTRIDSYQQAIEIIKKGGYDY